MQTWSDAELVGEVTRNPDAVLYGRSAAGAELVRRGRAALPAIASALKANWTSEAHPKDVVEALGALLGQIACADRTALEALLRDPDHAESHPIIDWAVNGPSAPSVTSEAMAGGIPASPHQQFDSTMARGVVHVSTRGLLGCVALILAGAIVRYALPPSGSTAIAVTRLIAAAAHGFGIGFGILFAILLITGALSIRFGTRGNRPALVAVIVVLLVAFLSFVPICWDPQSADCRSASARLIDALR